MYIVRETTRIIWEALNQTYMPIPNEEQWKKIAQRFYSLWNLPNCLGALDGKHIRIEKLPGTGSTNFNYKQYHSIVLLACTDADGCFTIIETGYAGRNSDGGIFRASAIKRWITSGKLNLPLPSRLPDDENEYDFPFYFVGDEAFPLLRYLMRPFPQRTLNNVNRICNYRLSRGRKSAECAFGMMAEKLQVLNSPIRSRTTERVVDIIKAVCILHNFIRKHEGIQYSCGEQCNNSKTPTIAIQPRRDLALHPQSTAHELRNYLANYFVTPRASLPWQWKYCISSDQEQQ